METVLHNHDGQGHDITVESIESGILLERTSFYIGPDETVAVELHPHATEVAVYPDSTADAVEPIHSHSLGVVPATSAVALFAIVNGVGGAASQLLAANKLSGTSTVPVSNVAAAGVAGIIGTVAAVYLL